MYNEIYHLEASGGYCYIYLAPDRPKIILAMTLTELMEYLPSEIFIRTHRSYIVNLNHIERITGNTLYIGAAQIVIGREYKKEVLKHLNIVGS
ncbi:LytR/AlgR family response regulator transcription factor [Bacteroides sp. GD17]|uniref:LytR/AlgR family response regulator transcription factor n=1 Tax=Bacteroides sp. GD17 TaxID=3139826 RepID=UPI00406C6BA9